MQGGRKEGRREEGRNGRWLVPGLVEAGYGGRWWWWWFARFGVSEESGGGFFGKNTWHLVKKKMIVEKWCAFYCECVDR